MVHWVYIMASRPGGAIYIGHAASLRGHVEAHRAGLSKHTAKYKIKTLVWFEPHPDYESSQHRARQLKRWRRAWKDQLIMGVNPEWRDVTRHIPL